MKTRLGFLFYIYDIASIWVEPVHYVSFFVLQGNSPLKKRGKAWDKEMNDFLMGDIMASTTISYISFSSEWIISSTAALEIFEK